MIETLLDESFDTIAQAKDSIKRQLEFPQAEKELGISGRIMTLRDYLREF